MLPLLLQNSEPLILPLPLLPLLQLHHVQLFQLPHFLSHYFVFLLLRFQELPLALSLIEPVLQFLQLRICINLFHPHVLALLRFLHPPRILKVFIQLFHRLVHPFQLLVLYLFPLLDLLQLCLFFFGFFFFELLYSLAELLVLFLGSLHFGPDDLVVIHGRALVLLLQFLHLRLDFLQFAIFHF